MNESKLKKYAELLVRVGGNVQKGQLVIIKCSVDCAYFGRLVLGAAYDAGAGEVRIDWDDDETERQTFLRADDKAFEEFPQWRVAKLKEEANKVAVYLYIESSDPDNLAGVDTTRLEKWEKIADAATEEHDSLMSNTLRWSVVAVPSPAWAKKVFPGLPEAEAIEKLWNYILKCSRADGEDPIAAWRVHDASFTKRMDYLNEQNFDSLRFTTGLGTDLTLGLVENHVWIGGSVSDKNGIRFVPNIPTEEIFTMPHRQKAEGKVVATMSLNYYGKLIEGFELTFKDGKVVDYKAEKNQDTLRSLLEYCKRGPHLGEVAIVANSSPIGQLKTLFYNTIYDENASAHLALGEAYPFSIKNGYDMTKEERLANGANVSDIHEDFMFGTADMKVVGIKQDGTEIVFFENGEFIV